MTIRLESSTGIFSREVAMRIDSIDRIIEDMVDIDHQKIFKFLELFDQILKELTSPEHTKERYFELKFMLEAFTSTLESHFKLEESFGELHDYLFQNELVKNEADIIYSQHKKLLEEARAMSKHVNNLFPNDPTRFVGVQKEFARFKSNLVNHNQDENEFFLKAFYNLKESTEINSQEGYQSH